MDLNLQPSIQVNPPGRRPPKPNSTLSFSQDTASFVSYPREAMGLSPTDIAVES